MEAAPPGRLASAPCTSPQRKMAGPESRRTRLENLQERQEAGWETDLHAGVGRTDSMGKRGTVPERAPAWPSGDSSSPSLQAGLSDTEQIRPISGPDPLAYQMRGVHLWIRWFLRPSGFLRGCVCGPQLLRCDPES